jgi:hypothetical protein
MNGSLREQDAISPHNKSGTTATSEALLSACSDLCANITFQEADYGHLQLLRT